VGLASVGKLAAWIAALPADEAAAVVGLQLANEPALNTDGYDAAVKTYYRRALRRARASLPSLPLFLSFIPPNDLGVPAFVQSLLTSEPSNAGPLIVDHHWYLTWASPVGTSLKWSDLHRRACHEARQSWSSYTAAGVRLVLGEWSLATNHDAPLDLSSRCRCPLCSTSTSCPPTET